MHGHTDCKDPASRDRLAAAAAEMGVRRILLLGDVIAFGFHPTPEQIRFINDATIADVKARPDLYSGMCHVNPENPADFTVSEIERCVREHGLKGVKLEATVICTDRRLDPIMETARRLGVFVLHHAWYQATRTTEGESTPADIADLASHYPDVPIQMAHLGGARVRGVLDIRPHRNVSIDTSGSQPLGELVEYAVRALGPDRIVYGSDVPGRDFSAQLGRVLGARISDADLRKILFENAERLLKL
jgi:predicted TIM-barrel fold metal-dependent hydrolase